MQPLHAANKFAEIQRAFDYYRNEIFGLTNQVSVWETFIDHSIKQYKEGNDQRLNSDRMFESIFCTYDIPHNSPNGWLKVYREPFELSIHELEKFRDEFFVMFLNLSLVKAYNACELFLLRAIQLMHFPTLSNPLVGNKQATKVSNEIKNATADKNAINNRHLLQFVAERNIEFAMFIEEPIRIDLKTTWKNLFELTSIVRHVVAHQSSTISKDVRNQMKSVAKDVLEGYFTFKSNSLPMQENSEDYILQTKRDSFPGLMLFINDFAVNAIKFIFERKNLHFLELY